MQGDPRVVAALAVAVLALAPVVNAIMAKAAEQADVDWLRAEDEDLPFEITPRPGGPFDIPPGEGELPEGAAPPPPQQPPPCTPVPMEGETRQVPGPVAAQPTGTLTLEVDPRDLAVAARIEGRGVSGQPSFRIAEDGAVVWDHQAPHVNEDISLPEGDAGVFPQPAPGGAWTLTYDLTGTVHQGFVLTLTTVRCAEAGP